MILTNKQLVKLKSFIINSKGKFNTTVNQANNKPNL